MYLIQENTKSYLINDFVNARLLHTCLYATGRPSVMTEIQVMDVDKFSPKDVVTVNDSSYSDKTFSLSIELDEFQVVINYDAQFEIDSDGYPVFEWTEKNILTLSFMDQFGNEYDNIACPSDIKGMVCSIGETMITDSEVFNDECIKDFQDYEPDHCYKHYKDEY